MTDSDEIHFTGIDCGRFVELVERQWADERPMTEEDRSFYTYHKNTCVECAEFDGMLSVFQDTTSETEITESSVDTIRKIVERKFAAAERRRYWIIAVAASVALGLSVVIAAALFERGASSTTAPFSLAEGSVIIEGHAIEVGEKFSFEKEHADIPIDTLIEIPDRLYIAMAEGAKIDHVEQSNTLLRLSLETGRIAVHLVPGSQMKVQVDTPAGMVSVKGTVFIVEAGRDADAVSVVRGSVFVKPKAAEMKSGELLEAGWAFTFNDRKQSPRVIHKADHLLNMLGIAETISDTPSAAVEVADTDDATLAVDLEATSTVAVDRPALDALLQAARECRAARNWNCAVDNYGKVVAYYPGLPDAATAMIPIAQIMLENLSKPKEALHYFRRYQKRRPEGGLGQEALYGECRSLEQLGRGKAEKECLTRYMEKYPNTLYTQMAKSRLTRIMVKD